MAIRDRLRARQELGKESLRLAARRSLWGGLRLSRRQSAVLQSFEQLRGPDGAFRATELLATVDAEPVDAYLVNGDSGFGKTTLALALAASRPRRVPDGRIRVVPVYLDTSNTGFAGRLTAWVTRLSEITQDGRSPVRDRAVVIFDAINESRDTAEVVRGIARHLDFLRSSHIALVFMFSYRHKSYAGELINTLADVGLTDIRTVTLDAVRIPSGVEGDELPGRSEVLPSYCALASRSQRSDLARDLAAYRLQHNDWAPTRLGVASVIDWRNSHVRRRRTSGYEASWQQMSPEEILVRQILEPSMTRLGGSRELLEHLARCALLMLGEEQVIFDLADLARKTENSSRGCLSQDEMAERLRPWRNTSHAKRLRINQSETEVRIDNEAAIRSLGRTSRRL